MKIQTKPMIIEITNKDKSFKGTEFEKNDFRIVMKQADIIETNELIKKYTSFKEVNGKETEDTDWNSINAELLSKSIIEIEGIEDEDGNKLEPTFENIKALMLYERGLFDLIYSEFNSKREAKKKSMKR